MDKTTTKELSVTLTEEEIADRSRTHARKTLEAEAMREEAKAKAKVSKDAIDKIEEEILALAKAVDSGKEKRLVPITERPDLRRFAVDTVRVDTMEVLETRAMKQEEIDELSQGRLFDASKVTAVAKATADSRDDAPPGDGEATTVAPKRGRKKDEASGAASAAPATAQELGPECPKCGEHGGHLLECPELGTAAPAAATAEATPPAPEPTPGTEIRDPAAVLAGGDNDAATKH